MHYCCVVWPEFPSSFESRFSLTRSKHTDKHIISRLARAEKGSSIEKTSMSITFIIFILYTYIVN